MAFEDHDAGQELLITYGQGNTAFEFWRDYGFCVPGESGRIPFVADAQRILRQIGQHPSSEKHQFSIVHSRKL